MGLIGEQLLRADEHVCPGKLWLVRADFLLQLLAKCVRVLHLSHGDQAEVFPQLLADLVWPLGDSHYVLKDAGRIAAIGDAGLGHLDLALLLLEQANARGLHLAEHLRRVSRDDELAVREGSLQRWKDLALPSRMEVCLDLIDQDDAI